MDNMLLSNFKAIFAQLRNLLVLVLSHISFQTICDFIDSLKKLRNNATSDKSIVSQSS